MVTALASSRIAQQAFRFLELSPLSSYADDSDQARAAAEAYPIALSTALAACDWSFASHLASLAQATEAGLVADPDLPFSFYLPDDFIRMQHVGPTSTGIETRWRIDGLVLRSDAPGPQLIRYTRRVENEQQLPGTFQTAVAAQLAILLSARELEAMGKRDRIKQDYEAALTQAMREDRQSASSQRFRADGGDAESDWVSEARL